MPAIDKVFVQESDERAPTLHLVSRLQRWRRKHKNLPSLNVGVNHQFRHDVVNEVGIAAMENTFTNRTWTDQNWNHHDEIKRKPQEIRAVGGPTSREWIRTPLLFKVRFIVASRKGTPEDCKCMFP